MTAPSPDDIEVIDLNELLPPKLKRNGVTLKHFEGHRTAEGVELVLRETRHMEPSYLPKAMLTFIQLFAHTTPGGQMLLMHILWEAGQGRASQLVDIGGETLIHMPDPRGDPAYDLYVQISLGEDSQSPAVKRKRKAKAKRVSSAPVKRDKKG